MLLKLLGMSMLFSSSLYTMQDVALSKEQKKAQSSAEQKHHAAKTKELFEFVKWGWRHKKPHERSTLLKKLLAQPGVNVNEFYRGKPILYIVAQEVGSHAIQALREDITIYQLLLEAKAAPFATNKDAPRQTAREILAQEIDQINRQLKLPFYQENPHNENTVNAQKQLKQLQEIVELLLLYEKKAVPSAPLAPHPMDRAPAHAGADSN